MSNSAFSASCDAYCRPSDTSSGLGALGLRNALLLPLSKLIMPVIMPVIMLVVMLGVMLGGGAVFAPQSQAAVNIEFPGNVTLSFDDGNFDAQRYDGQMLGASLYVEGDLILTADSIDLASEGTPSDGDFIVRQLDMINVALIPNKVTMQSLQLRNITVGAFEDLMTATAFDNMLGDDTSIIATGITATGITATGFVDELPFGTLRVDSFETLPLIYKTLPDGSRFAEAGGVEANGITYASNTYMPDEGDNSPQALALRKFTSLVWDITASQRTELVLGALESRYSFEVNARNQGRLSLTGAINTQLDTHRKLLALSVSRQDNTEAIYGLLGEIELVSLGLDYTDNGLINLSAEAVSVMNGTSPEAAKQKFLDRMADRTKQIFPRNGENIINPFNDLIMNGGGLRARMAPNSALKLSKLLGLMIIPDLILDRLNFQIAHLKGS